MKKQIEKQILKNKGKNLLYRNVEEIMEIGDEFLKSLIQQKENELLLRNELIEFIIDKILAAIYQINQLAL